MSSRLIRKLFAPLGLLLGSALLTGAVTAETPIRIAYPSGLNGQIPLVADKAGIAEKNGLQAQFNLFQNGPPMMEALASNNVDVVVSSYQPLTTYLLKQPGSVSVVANLGHSSYALVVAEKSTFSTLADLKGKRIALSFGSDSHLDLLRSIKQLGLDLATDFQLINLQPSDLKLALAQNQTDAIVIRQPHVQLLQEEGARVVQSWPHYYLVIVRNAYLEKYPAARAALLQTLRQSVAYIAQNGAETADWFGKQQHVDARVVRTLAAQNPLIADVGSADEVRLEFDDEHVARFNEWLVAAYQNGLIKTPVPAYPGTSLAENQ